MTAEVNLGGEEQAPGFMELVDRLPPALLAHALRHVSWTEDRLESYERLEFLGDSVLGLAVASYLFNNFPDFEEGRLAKLRAYVVSRPSCAVVARRLGVDSLIRARAPAHEEQRVEVARNRTVLGNVLEALIGAIFLTWGFETAQAAIVGAFREQIAYGLTRHVDYKSALQEHLAAADLRARYQLVATEGPPHSRVFTSEVYTGERMLGRGRGRSIKTSEQEAAREALMALGVLSESGVHDPPVDLGD